jgi:hypothetical protein
VAGIEVSSGKTLMLKYLTGYDCVDSGSSPEGSELSDSSNDSRRNAENGGDGASQILYLSKFRVAYKSFFLLPFFSFILTFM